MGVVWAVLALFASGPELTLEISEPAPPEWVQEVWQTDGARLIATVLPEGDVQIVATADFSSPGRLDIAASTEGERIEIYLSGDGWRNDTEKARRLLRQNLAHELAHVGQLHRLDTAFEPRVLHEGYAEARSVDLLVEAKIWTVAEARRAALGMEQKCLRALQLGPLWPQIEAGDEEATYACGAVIWLNAAAQQGVSLEALHRSYAEAMMDPPGLGLWSRDHLGRNFTRSVVRFLTTDYSGGAGFALEGLAAGRL